MSWWCIECGKPRDVGDFGEPCANCGAKAMRTDLGGDLVPIEDLEPRLGVATLPEPPR